MIQTVCGVTIVSCSTVSVVVIASKPAAPLINFSFVQPIPLMILSLVSVPVSFLFLRVSFVVLFPASFLSFSFFISFAFFVSSPGVLLSFSAVPRLNQGCTSLSGL